MTLRAIAVPGGLTHDRRFYMGINQIDADRQIYESSFESHIAASFEAKDLPKSWIPKLGTQSTGAFSYYFMGKYEVSKLQWDVVMQGLNPDGSEKDFALPKDLPKDANLPVRHISWFEVQDFFKRYTAWLIKYKLDDLPKYAGTSNIGFLRLPTEAEWEFAARGGIAVKEEDRENNDSFLKSDERPEDYGVFISQSANILDAPLAIGSRKPNPLGLYDTMGNVREMIAGFFQLTIAELGIDHGKHRRLHGSAGGLLCKGGSFRSYALGVLPGWRDEVPLYTRDGEYRANDLGFRLVLVGLNLPSADRLAKINQADEERTQSMAPEGSSQALPKNLSKPTAQQSKPLVAGSEKESQDKLVNIDPKGDLLAELDRVTDATSSSVVRANLAQLRAMVAEHNRALSRQRLDFLESSIRSTLYQAEIIRAFAFRYVEINKLIEDIKDDPKFTLAQKKKAEDVRIGYYRGLLTAANQYKSQLRRILQAGPQQIEQVLAQIGQEYSGSDQLDRHMLQNSQILGHHLVFARSRGVDALASEKICKDIIPKAHFIQIHHFKP
ncbi:MAG: SUMF1/EgtB/PvdO family nonheme iron enzyme [Desulfovibrionaceae bacterium]|nr:SUMF1/EgtB/PvdO family nonheme iron enzyme [Desulfovibrionaceae bacterium]